MKGERTILSNECGDVGALKTNLQVIGQKKTDGILDITVATHEGYTHNKHCTFINLYSVRKRTHRHQNNLSQLRERRLILSENAEVKKK
jgi:hypothetical protein